MTSRRPGRRSGGPTVWIMLIGIPILLGITAWSTTIGDERQTGAAPSTASAIAQPPAPTAPGASADVPAADGADPFGLARLTVAAGVNEPPYEREAFGQPWSDVDRNGCDTRNDILGRDLVDTVFKPGTRDCKVLSGLLHDPYTGVPIHFVSGQDTSVLVQIDHIVALSYAWRHGASAWTAEQRVAYANDPLNLIAVDGPTNMGKGDDGPSDWLPENTAYLCPYLGQFVEVLAVNGLTVEPADYAVLDALSPECAA